MAASCAATSRLGWTSVARMLPDTSIARMMVCWFDGSMTTAIGRAAASSMAARASRNSSGGMWRRTLWPAPMASSRSTGWRSAAPASSCAASARRTAAPAAAAPAAARGIGARGSSWSRLLRRLASGARQAAPAASLARRLRMSVKRTMASTRSPSVDSSSASTPARHEAPRAGRPRVAAAMRAKRLRKPASWVSTSNCSPVSASRSGTRPRSGRSSSSGSNRRTATTSWRCASCASGRSQPGSLMKSETTNTVERRWISVGGRLPAGRRSRVVPDCRARARPRGAASRAAGAAHGAGRCAAESPRPRRCRRASRRPGCRGA